MASVSTDGNLEADVMYMMEDGMYQYSIIQWLFFFYFYCFFGWCFESAFVSVKNRKPVNRGFMRGPFLPLYGSGAIMMLVVSMPVKDNLFLVYLAGCLGATALEYVTGVTMETLFKVRYWDYSKQRFQFQGQICLSSTIAWGFLTILMTEVVHKPIERLSLQIPAAVLTVLVLILTAVIAADFSMSFRAALDLRTVLAGLEKAKEEMEHMQKRLDVMIAVADSEIGSKWEEKKQQYADRSEELAEGIEARLTRLKELALSRPTDSLDNVKEELAQLRRKFALLKENKLGKGFVKDFYRRHMILDNPSMYSSKFRDALEELKQAAKEHRREDRE